MHSEYQIPGGKLVVINLGVRDGHVANVQLSGDLFLEPGSALRMINAALTDQPADTNGTMLAITLREAIPSDA